MGYKDKIDNSYRGKTRTWEDQLRALRLGIVSRIYQGADRILTGDPIVVNVVEEGPAPSWSDGATITLNAAMIDSMDLETITQINGLNYHELSHHLYTPRRGTPLVQWVIEEDCFMAFNVLEDQRIDSLLCARYPSIMPYLTAAVLRYLADSPREAEVAYVAVRGRRYLPVEIRKAFRDLFYKPELLPDIIRIVDEYRTLAFPRDYNRAKELIKEFHDKIIDKLDRPLSGGISQCGHRAPIVKGRPDPGKQQEKDAQRAKGNGNAEPELTQEQLEELIEASQEQNVMNQGGNVTEPDDQADATEESEEAKASETKPSEQEQDGKPEGARDRKREVINSTPKVGKGHMKSDGGLPDDIHLTIQNALNDIYNRKDVMMDVKRKQRIIINGGKDDDYEETGRSGNYSTVTVPQSEIITYRKFAKELQRLRDDAEPSWQKEMPSGRLAVQRLMRKGEVDIETAFDRWTEQDDSCNIEAVICIDRSGSMTSNRNDERASLASWVIKRALESIGAPVTVYAFDDQTEVAYSRNEQAHSTQFKFINGSGGTDPYESLVMAEKVLVSSQRTNKMLFIVTDGVFNADKNDEIIERISKRGILTCMVLIMRTKEYEDATAYNRQALEAGGRARWEFRHNAEIFGQVESGRDLLALARTVVLGAIKKKSRRF